MENEKNLIINLFNSKFDLQKFINFAQIVFKGKVEYRRNLEFSPKVKREFNSVVKSFLNLGRYTDIKKKNIVLAVVEIRKEDSIARARTIQRNFVKDYFLKNGADSALVAFYSDKSEDWRLSFIKLDYSYKNYKLQEDITPAKRFSFLLGKNEKHHTAVERFMYLIKSDKEYPTIDELEEVFNIEVITKEFFEKYCDLYLRIKKELDKQEGFSLVAKKANIKSDEFAKKLMGQLVFLYFLQKKGWLGVKVNPSKISKDEANKLLNNKTYECKEVFDKVYHLNEHTYYRDNKNIVSLSDDEINCLNSIFINTKYDEKWGSGDKSFIRSMFNEAISLNKNFFKDYLEPMFYNALNDKRGGNTYFKNLNCKIPFLNGGLFQPISEDYNYKNADFTLNNSLFSNRNKNKKGDIGDGIIDIFDRYAFTIKEDEPLEKEVAVDPEMLGKVFENLLDITDRKKKGAFYTPREIVHYMCQESLINYLITEINLTYDEAESFIRYGDILSDIDTSKDSRNSGNYKMPLKVRKQAKKIDDILSNVKVADPAVGSGAFPLGMLNEIVKARMNLIQYLSDDIDVINFTNIKNRKCYEIKLNTIKKCIHAVDIDRSAVEIAKLRLWLSLVVEENDFSNIKPLPNLDYNIMVGNSLLEEFEGVKLFNEKLVENKTKSTDYEQTSLFEKRSKYLLDEIYNLQDKFFEINNKDEKIKIKHEIDQLEWDIIENTVRENNKQYLLPKIKELKRTNSKPYFLWKLNFAKVFREKGGFDIVIGNPPYVGEKGNKEIFRPIAASEFGKKFYKGKMDLFYFFFHKSIDISKTNGIIGFITTNYYITATGAYNLRLDLKNRCVIKNLINFNELKIFESALGQHNMITLLQKKRNIEEYSYNLIVNNKGFANNNKLYEIFYGNDKSTNYYKIKQKNLYEGENNYIRLNGFYETGTNSTLQNILFKLKNTKYTLGDICNIKQGIVSGADKVTDAHINKYNGNWSKGDGIFVLSKEELNNLNLNEFEMTLVKNLYKNSQISQYNIKSNDNLYVLYVTKDLKENEIPNIITHLAKYKNILSEKRETKEGKLPWYCLHWPRDKNILESNLKIVNPRRAKSNIFALEVNKRYEQSDIMISVIKNNFLNNINEKYLVGFLNSSLCRLWLENKGKMKGNLFELYGTPLSEIPIMLPSNEIKSSISNIVDKLLFLDDISNNELFIKYKNEIDKILINAYNLNENEKNYIYNLNNVTNSYSGISTDVLINYN